MSRECAAVVGERIAGRELGIDRGELRAISVGDLACEAVMAVVMHELFEFGGALLARVASGSTSGAVDHRGQVTRSAFGPRIEPVAPVWGQFRVAA
ncbi:MAG: hypothetical protein ACR2PG_08015 [Hyphomicrobiaceae bacterium]